MLSYREANGGCRLCDGVCKPADLTPDLTRRLSRWLGSWLPFDKAGDFELGPRLDRTKA